MPEDDSSWIESLAEYSTDVQSAADLAWADQWIDTGNLVLNWAVSGRLSRGFPAGHIVEIFGQPATGKTLIASRTAASVQDDGGRAAFDDVEGGFNPEFASRSLGVDLDNLALVEGAGFGTVEEHYEHVSDFCEYLEETGTELPHVYILDSVGALSPEKEIESGMGSSDMGLRAKRLKRLYNHVKKRIKNLPVVYVATNHVYTSPDPFQHGEESPGGKALKFHSTIRIHLRAAKQEDDYTVARGKVVKNRVSGMMSEFELFIPRNAPVERASGLIPMLLEQGIIGKSGHSISYDPDADPEALMDGDYYEDGDVASDNRLSIKAQKTNPEKRWRSERELLEQHPGIVEHADEVFALQEQKYADD